MSFHAIACLAFVENGAGVRWRTGKSCIVEPSNNRMGGGLPQDAHEPGTGVGSTRFNRWGNDQDDVEELQTMQPELSRAWQPKNRLREDQ